MFDRRADNLMATLERMMSDIGSASAMLDNHIHDTSGWWIDTDADEVFFFIKGRLYANLLILRELEPDFVDVLREKQLQSAWKQMLQTYEEAARLGNLLTFNAKPGSQFLPNHLAVQGFYLLRARTQMAEIINILLK